MAKILMGRVVSTKMKNTIVIEVDRKFRHQVYGKIVKKSKKFKAHCEDDKIKVGDIVSIQETRPMSREKHFIVISNIKDQISK